MTKRSSGKHFPTRKSRNIKIIIEGLMGVDKAIVLQQTVLGSLMSVIFGCLGSAMVPAVVRRLKANKLIS